MDFLSLACFSGAATLGLVAIGSKLKQSPLMEQLRLKGKPAADTPVKPPSETVIDIKGSSAGFLNVLDADALITVCHAGALIDNIRRQSRLPAAVFDRDLLPAIHAYCRFVQLMPASEAHHHAHTGGLLAHTLEVLNAAMTLRNAYLLPRGGGAETIDAQRDHWTYAVCLAALFHDVGKPMTDLRIDMQVRTSSDPVRWMPIAGSLAECGATEYRVDFAPKSERDYGAHRRFPVALMQRLVSSHALAFIAREPALMLELSAFLSGEPGGAASAIAEIVRRADQESTRWNLAQGPRNRFATARAVPLIERLMQALRAMLAAGGALPLNRDGAIGWVFDGAVWFVAKRLADTVREHVTRTSADDDSVGGIPGANKNDRLFDTWQEYGMIAPNPETGQSIWYVAVEGEGYRHELTMLRFPLEKLYENVSLYPPPMQGSIRILARKGKSVEKSGAKESDALPQSASAETVSALLAEPAPMTAAVDRQVAPAIVSAPSDDAIPAPKKAGPAGNKKKPASAKSAEAVDDAIERNLRHADPDDDLMPDEDSATHEARRINEQKRPAGQARGAMTPYVPTPPPLPGMVTNVEGAREPSEAAIRFMDWLQQGIADGSMKYNEVSAPVHFVKEGMLLVSPRIFRDFATQFGEAGDGTPSDKSADKLGLGIQRQVVTAGWNAVGPRNSNIFHFSVLKRGGVRVSKLAAVVILRPERWISPVPPANPNIVPFEAEETDRKSKETIS